MSRILRWERNKDPDEFLDYSMNWENELGSDTIVTSTWSKKGSPDVASPLVLSNDTVSASGLVTTVWLNAGVSGTTYTLTNQVITVGNRTMENSVYITVRPR